MAKIIGIIPARMGSSRFPGKPLADIHGKTMIEHVYARANLYENWDALYLATCDDVIADLGVEKGWDILMTEDSHHRPLDRVAEAAKKLSTLINDDDIIVCVQGDEPMLRPDMIDAVVSPFFDDKSVDCTVLGMHIIDEKFYYDPNTVKIVHDQRSIMLYTSRSPIPYSENFSASLNAKRIYGILAFRKSALDSYTSMLPTDLEVIDSCDSNRLCGSGLKQKVISYPCIESFSVDTPEGLELVKSVIKTDPTYELYNI